MGRPKGVKNKRRPNGNIKVCGQTIYYHRLAHGMTQGEMAKKIGISARNLQRIANPEVIALVDKWNEEGTDKLLN